MTSRDSEPLQAKRRRLAKVHLEFARDALTARSQPRESWSASESTMMAELERQLRADELESALETLSVLGDLAPCRGGFWRDLHRSADYLGLSEASAELKKRFHHALEAVPTRPGHASAISTRAQDTAADEEEMLRSLATKFVGTGLRDQLRARGYLVLLPLLEVPYARVSELTAQQFSAFGIPVEETSEVSLADLVAFALQDEGGSRHWSELALRWLEQGLPLTEAITDALRRNPFPRSAQRERHRVQRLLARLARSEPRKA